MPRCLPPRYRRPGHRRIGERANRDADVIRAELRVPEHRGAAIGTEMKLDLSPRVAAAHVDLAWPLGAHLLLREKDDEAEGGASTPLALHAVTDGDTRRLAGHLRAQRPTTAMGDPGPEKPPVWRWCYQNAI